MTVTMGDSRVRRRPSLLWPTLSTLIALAILVALGVWQLERLAWKNGLVAMIAARTTAPPSPLPPEADWMRLAPNAYAYRHVTVEGRFEHDKEAHVFRPLSDPRGRYSGLGDLVLTPLRLASGAVVIVNRGFVPDNKVDPSTRVLGQIEGPVTVTGLMREPESRNAFTPADDPAHSLWFTRDPASIAQAFGLDRVAPFTIDQDASAIPGGLPQGGETVLSLPNDHLSYALTWFGLAFGLLLVYAVFVWRALFSAPVEPGV
ncbi:SURF1 family protein [Lichenihabitans psoromatis]|uniref:SURF1 family protein n=1 Tax=Lichenihabitans psoromatis TaxID=2528642 RepID=UPI00315C80DB